MKRGILVIAWDSDHFEKWLGNKECQDETKQFPLSKIWVATESGIWPRTSSSAIYYGTRDSSMKPDGYGKAYFTNGEKWSGKWEKGMLNGHGCVESAIGDVYEG